MPETTENYHRVKTGKTKKKGDKIRTITISKTIKALYTVATNVDTKEIITYLFDKESYTMKEAKKWVKNHKENAIHQQLVEIDDLMQRRETLMQTINQDIYDKVMEMVDDSPDAREDSPEEQTVEEDRMAKKSKSEKKKKE